MPFNINEIISDINHNNGFLRSSHFDVLIPTIQVPGAEVEAKTLTLSAEYVNIPALQLTTQEIYYGGYGMFESRPSNMISTECEVRFLVDGNANIPDFFHRWMKRISNFDGFITGDDNRDLFEYPSNYWSDIEINQYRVDGQLVNTYKLINAYPKQISSVIHDWGQQNSLLNFTVMFEYLTLQTTKME